MKKRWFLNNRTTKELKDYTFDEDLTLWLKCHNCSIESDRLVQYKELFVCKECVEYVQRRKMLLETEKEWDIK